MIYFYIALAVSAAGAILYLTAQLKHIKQSHKEETNKLRNEVFSKLGSKEYLQSLLGEAAAIDDNLKDLMESVRGDIEEDVTRLEGHIKRYEALKNASNGDMVIEKIWIEGSDIYHRVLLDPEGNQILGSKFSFDISTWTGNPDSKKYFFTTGDERVFLDSQLNMWRNSISTYEYVYKIPDDMRYVTRPFTEASCFHKLASN